MIKELQQIISETPSWRLRERLEEFIEKYKDEPEPKKGTRSGQQNKSIHLWLAWIADELNRNGHTMQNVLERIKRAEIRPTMIALKEVVWKPYQTAAFGKESSTQLTKNEVTETYEGLNKFFGQEFEIHIPFPDDSEISREMDYKNKASKMEIEYPSNDDNEVTAL